MAERSNAAVLKTVDGQPSGGSNPSLCANKMRRGTFVSCRILRDRMKRGRASEAKKIPLGLEQFLRQAAFLFKRKHAKICGEFNFSRWRPVVSFAAKCGIRGNVLQGYPVISIKNRTPSPFLPKKMQIFVDNCRFILDIKKSVYYNLFTINILECCTRGNLRFFGVPIVFRLTSSFRVAALGSLHL